LVDVEDKYLCSAEFPTTLELSTEVAVMEDKERGVKYQATWNSQEEPLKIEFTLTSANVTQAYLTQVENAAREYSQRVKDFLLQRDRNQEWVSDIDSRMEQLREEGDRWAQVVNEPETEFGDADSFDQVPQPI
jgi:hypothetical protein